MKTGYLVLADGQVFQGLRFGAEADTVGELVFTTGMCGYVETLTDPSYAGQIVLQTYPLIGNCGIIPEDFEGDCHVRGYVVRERCDHPSNFRSEGDLDGFLKERGVPGLYGVDTRQLTRILRESVVMNALICDQVPPDLSGGSRHPEGGRRLPAGGGEPPLPGGPAGLRRQAQHHPGAAKAGLRGDGVPRLHGGGNRPGHEPDGVMLSNGPGDPAENVYQIAQIQKLLGKVPLFGICLGHQLTALAAGGKTYKLKYGHRGVNQPVRDLGGPRTYITSQNHGYAVDAGSVKRGRVSFANANDGTCEGLDYPGLRAFTVQFHPEARGGPRDTAFLFDRFVEWMKGGER